MRVRIVLSSVMAAATMVLAGAPEAHASHFRYGTMQWTPTATAGEVRFDLRVALRRNGYSPAPVVGSIITETIGQTRLSFGDSQVTPVLQFIVTDFSATENWIVAQALEPGTASPGIPHTYVGAGPFTARKPERSACAWHM